MFLLTPFKALYDMGFYVDYLKKSPWKAVLYACYVTLISCVLISAVMTVKAPPVINKIITKTAELTPDIVIKNGEITANEDIPLTVAPEELNGAKIVFDTGRTDPVYPTQMQAEKIMVFVTKKAVYFSNTNTDQVQVTEVPKAADIKLSSATIAQNQSYITRIALYAIVLILILGQIVVMPLMIFLFFLVCLIVNAANGKPLKAGQCLKAGCFLLAPYVALYFTSMLLPFKMPLMIFIYLLMAGIYCIFITRAYLIDADKAVPFQTENKPFEDNDPFEK